MGRLLWPLGVVVAFVAGLVAGGALGPSGSPGRPAAATPDTVSRLQEQVSLLQARLRARDDRAAPPAATPSPARDDVAPARALAAAPAPIDRGAPPGPAPERAGAGWPRPADVAPEAPGGQRVPGQRRPAPPATVEAALERFYTYLDAASAPEGRERWQRMRELVNELRAMGEAGSQALLQVLASGADMEERRAAARLLGTLQVPQAVPALRDVLDREDDVLLRRAAASALRQVPTAESVSLMERLVASPAEDRFVRLSAAYGLAEAGRPLGVLGLTQIFDESTGDGRGRELAFRAIASLKDDRALPFMRQVVVSDVEPAYRLRAIRFLTAQADRQALAALQTVMQSAHEQASLRDAAAQAHAAISGR
jgi:hypothetical protein